MLVLIAAVAATSTAHAAIINNSSGTANASPAGLPGNFAYWDAIGKISSPSDVNYLNGGTALYLGNGYCLTTQHIKNNDNPVNATFAGVQYDIVAGSWDRLDDAVLGTQADLTLFRINQAGGSYPLTSIAPSVIASASPAANATVYMIGYGKNRQAAKTTWYIDTTPTPFVWQTSSFPGYDTTISGYAWAADGSKTLRWGSNTIEGTINPVTEGVTRGFYTTFDSSGGGNECQVADGDSGGAVFTYADDTGWSLVGLMLSRATFSGQPHASAVYGDESRMADLTLYRSQIVPEPASLCLLLIVGAGWAARRR